MFVIWSCIRIKRAIKTGLSPHTHPSPPLPPLHPHTQPGSFSTDRSKVVPLLQFFFFFFFFVSASVVGFICGVCFVIIYHEALHSRGIKIRRNEDFFSILMPQECCVS